MKRKNDMTKKEAFIEIVNYFFEDNDVRFENDENFKLAAAFWEEFKNGKVKNSGAMTENGAKLLSWMQENVENMSNMFTSKEIAEGLFTSGRSISGSMRKLVSDGYVEKINGNPIRYSLTEAGRNYQFEN